MSQQKVYIPLATRTSQYIMAEILMTDALLSHYASYENCYREISKLVFQLAEKEDLHNIHVIANDKLPVVRFHTEAYCFQTAEQILFFYNPAYHEAQNLFFQPDYKARKLRLLFLATGKEIRANAANFHSRVNAVLNGVLDNLPEQELRVKVRDHQHMAYDLFARAKGEKKTYGYKLRDIYQRYKSRKCKLPEDHSSLAYVTVSLPLSRRLKQSVLEEEHTEDFSPLYQFLEDKFRSAAAGKQLHRIAMVANGLMPLVRNSKFEKVESTAEAQMIGFDPAATDTQFVSHWDGRNLVESVHFLLVAGKEDYTEPGYGRYMNQVEAALKDFADAIGLDPERRELVLRFHQHISYKR
ncbi:DUF3083 family protein [Shewanella algae]|uniref:DUF3083 family protein n=1 Tax=Shewanella algae TaxID=38313 RepID=UPI001F366F97|nr:DUF3083 family protein [Shewanella algae]MCE9782118.1 DUF3083 family protein [Shewanella algae]